VHDLKGLDFVSVKIASEQDALHSQEVVKAASSEIYGVICKEAAAHVRTEDPLCMKVVSLLKEAADVLKKEPLSDEMGVKIAAAVSLDDAYGEMLKSAAGKQQEKLAEQRAYGREFMLELVREVI
jgi:hypothetical protein